MRKRKRRRPYEFLSDDSEDDDDYEISGPFYKNVKRSDRLAAKFLSNQGRNVRGSRQSLGLSEDEKHISEALEGSPMLDSDEPSAEISPALDRASGVGSCIDSAHPKHSDDPSLLMGRLSSVDPGNLAKRGKEQPQPSGNRHCAVTNSSLKKLSQTAKPGKDHSVATPSTPMHDEEDEDCVILRDGEVHIASTVKMEQHSASVKTEQLSYESMAKTTFIVTASNQPTIAPVIVPFTSCKTFDRLFETLISECDVRAESAKRVSKISAKNTWNGKQVRIRKGRTEDWTILYTGLCKAWNYESERFEDGCEVEMVIHIDD